MADHRLGKIYISFDNHDFMWDHSDPVQYGLYIMDIVGTNRWPYLTTNPDFQTQSEVWHNSLIELIGAIYINKDEPMIESGKGHDIILPSCFSPFKITFLDILVYIGFKLRIFTIKETTKLSREWVDDNLLNRVNLIIRDTKSKDTRLKLKLNKVIEYLISNKIRIGAVCASPISLLPEGRFTLEDFPELEKLRFCCYSITNTNGLR